MLRFFSRPSLGIDITLQALTVGAVIRNNGGISLLDWRTIALSAGMVQDLFSASPDLDRQGLVGRLRESLGGLSHPKVRRVGLSLPDGLFRVQMLDLDDLPTDPRDRERLLRWRLEKAAGFDMADTRLRYQVIPRSESGFTVLASIIRNDMLLQYESVLTDAGLEPWNVAPASFHAMNLYGPVLGSREVHAYAFVWITSSSSCTLVFERGGLRFYRFREIKPGSPAEVTGRLTRELEDTLHFYIHRDRRQLAEIGHLYLAGEPSVIAELGGGLASAISLEVEVLTPPAAVAGSTDAVAAIAPAAGAGGIL